MRLVWGLKDQEQSNVRIVAVRGLILRCFVSCDDACAVQDEAVLTVVVTVDAVAPDVAAIAEPVASAPAAVADVTLFVAAEIDIACAKIGRAHV